MANSQQLNQRFACDGARFEDAPGGLVRAVIETSGAQGEVYLHGAHITRFQPAGHAPVLFLSEKSHFASDKPIRGGVPICFPWFGPREGDESAPMHGLARILEWNVESVAMRGDDVEIVLSLAPQSPPHPGWPTCALRYVVSFGASLKMQLEVKNSGDKSFRFAEALHTYFYVGDVRHIEIQGLSETHYIDKTDDFQEKTQSHPGLNITGETDRIYLNTKQTCVIHDPAYNREIRVSKDNSEATVVWNPWQQKAAAMPDFGDDEWTKMVCIETCNVNNCEVELQPDASHVMTAKIDIARV